MGKQLNFDTGFISYEVNGEDVGIRLNLTDTEFFRKLYYTFESLDKVCNDYQKRMVEIPDEEGAKRYEVLMDLDKEIENRIDTAFNSPGLSEKIFRVDGVHISPNAMAGGLPIWANFLLAVIDEYSDAVKAQANLTQPKINQYLKKYQGKKKYHK